MKNENFLYVQTKLMTPLHQSWKKPAVLKYTVLKRCLWLCMHKQHALLAQLPLFLLMGMWCLHWVSSFSFWTQCYGYFKIIYKFVVRIKQPNSSLTRDTHAHNAQYKHLSLNWHIQYWNKWILYNWNQWVASNCSTLLAMYLQNLCFLDTVK